MPYRPRKSSNLATTFYLLKENVICATFEKAIGKTEDFMLYCGRKTRNVSFYENK